MTTLFSHILIADVSLGNVAIPAAVLLGLEVMFAAVPIVERSDDRYALCIRRPHAKPNSARVRNGTHALDLRIAGHVWCLTIRRLFLDYRSLRWALSAVRFDPTGTESGR